TKIVKVTGSTGISAFSVGMPHIERAVEFVDGLTVTASTSIKLKDGAASTTYAAGERATFVCAGTAWYEV
ncbi:hypothetical protein KC887_10265, partial [Candidatus Kaiserbacteria bacterium]|nr:hypothetical protein [Candidatus Kaiserbacteria bacterium]